MIPILTERLELAPPVAGDREALRAIVAHPATGRFLGRNPADPPEHFVRFARNAGSWQLYGYGSFTLRLRATGEVIGNTGVFHSWRGLGPDFDDRPEAGWILRHDMVGQGYAREAMEAALGWFDAEYGPRPVMCMIGHGNAPSLALAARLGFAPLRDAALGDGERVHLLQRAPPGG